MSDIVMIGGGVVGTCTATMLARDGHRVTVLERDPTPPPAPQQAWEHWDRRGVNQFRQLHFLLPRFTRVMDVELPDMRAALLEAGASSWNPIDHLPSDLTGGWQEGDERFENVTGRRPVVESVIATLAGRTAGLAVRRGVAVRSLVAEAGRDGIPHVTGVVTDGGETLAADLVVDAGGRRSSLPDLLRAAGAEPPIEELEDCGFVYYGRHFRARDGATPAPLGPLLLPFGSVSVLTLPCDNDTWGVGIVTSARDTALRRLTDPVCWEAVVRSFPMVAHWLEGEPITDIQLMAKIEDRHRTFVRDGEPVATGVVAVGDAWACTNPSVGRGISIGALHGQALRDLLRETPPADGRELARHFHQLTEERVEPLYRDTLAFDRHRLAEIEATIEGQPYETDDPAWNLGRALGSGAMHDPELMRAFLDIICLLDRGIQVLMRPGIAARALELADPTPLPGPDRDGLLAIITDAMRPGGGSAAGSPPTEAAAIHAGG
ncbi:MAG: NAD(P)/FAD-dependent oxidoreductase [Ilumatobacteraceae bacterium]